jgi:NDP-sugar pyrophosphorylase family protein
MHHIDYGLSVLRRGVVASIPAGPPADLGAVLSSLATRGELAAYEATDRFFEIGTEASLAELDSMLSVRETARP